MKDNYGREINYLRISLTQRCNLNCIYCGCEKPDTNELSAEEIETIVKAFSKLGIIKVRLTGGEPLMRTDIAEIIKRIKSVEGIQKLVMTTNGVGLSKKVRSLKESGLDAINISLDSLDKEKYKKLTGRDTLSDVLSGIDKALEIGLTPIRINSVLIRGENDNEAAALIELVRNKKIDVRFIELMPFSEKGKNEKLVIKADEILKNHSYLLPVNSSRNEAVAKYYTAEGFKGQIGFITPVSDKFCDKCNRIRLLSDGKLKPCLGHNEVFDLRNYIDNEEKLMDIIQKAIFSKPMGHNFECAYGNLHAMNKIGG